MQSRVAVRKVAVRRVRRVGRVSCKVVRATRDASDNVTANVIAFYNGSIERIVSKDCVLRVGDKKYSGPDAIQDYLLRFGDDMRACALCDHVPDVWPTRRFDGWVAMMKWQCVDKQAHIVDGVDTFMFYPTDGDFASRIIIRRIQRTPA